MINRWSATELRYITEFVLATQRLLLILHEKIKNGLRP